MRHRWGLLLALLLAGGGLSAQDPEEREKPEEERRAEQERAVALGVVQVTAQRRKEDVQRIPLSVTALSEIDFENRQIRRLDDLQAQVPNIIIQPNTGTTTGAKIFLRGVGADESLFTNDPAVAIYIDDVYIPRQTGALFALYDIERIEVLRGPQGTLYGRNATGGAIRFVTRKPGGPETLVVDGLVGNFGRADARLSWSKDLAENWFLQLAMLTRNRDGYMRDVSFDRKVNDEEVHAARVSVLGRLDERTTVTLSGDLVRERSGPAYATGVIRSPIPRPPGPGGQPRPPRPVNDPDRNYYTLETDLGAGKNDLDQAGISVVAETVFSPGLEWRNILAWRSLDNLLFGDFDGTAQRRLHLFQDQSQYQWSYESQLNGSGERLEWVLGLFRFFESNEQPTRQDVFTTGPTNFIAQDTSAWALFGQATWQATERLRLTGGLRQSYEHKKLLIDSVRPNGTPNFQVNRDRKWWHLSWRAAADFQVSDEVFAYASAATGFKSGGFNGRGTAPNLVTTVDEEEVLSYEVGLKSVLLDGRLRLNLNYYRNNYDDLQLSALNEQGLFVLINAADTRIQGYELEFSALPIDNLRLYGMLGTIDAKYVRFSEVNRPIFEGRKLKQAPELTYSLGFDFSHPLGAGQLTFSAQHQFTDEHFQNVANSEIIKTRAFRLTNARLAYESADRRWAVALVGRNLTDTEYFTGSFDVDGLDIANAYMNVPRQYGIEFKYFFW